jgi:hypothetical protein
MISDARKDCDVFREYLTVVHFNCRYITLRIDLFKLLAGFGQLGLQVNTNPVEGHVGFVHGDMVGEAASARRIIELHDRCLRVVT